MMSLEQTIDAMKLVVNKIEDVNFLEQEESLLSNIKSFTTEKQDYLNRVKTDENPLNLCKTLVEENKDRNMKYNASVENALDRLEKLNNKKTTIQARIESIENHLKQNAAEPNQNLTQKLTEKRDCVFAWKFLTGTSFDFSAGNVSGYYFNKKTQKYATFTITKDSNCSENLWSELNKNVKGDA